MLSAGFFNFRAQRWGVSQRWANPKGGNKHDSHYTISGLKPRS